MLRVVTWNLNHRARQRQIAPAVSQAVAALSPDIAVLTEYVEGQSHSDFVTELAKLGFSTVFRSAKTVGQNQILVASHLPIALGTFRAPALDPALPSNVLHVRVPEFEIDVVGIRVPAYENAESTNACWNWLANATAAFLTRPAVLIGDFNVDPSRASGARLRQLIGAGWQHAWQEDGWSFCSTGGSKTRIDHAFVSPKIRVRRASYVSTVGSYVLAGTRSALSDHAALVVEADITSRAAV